VIGQIRTQLIAIAKEKRQRVALKTVAHPETDKCKMAKNVMAAIGQLKTAVVPNP